LPKNNFRERQRRLQRREPGPSFRARLIRHLRRLFLVAMVVGIAAGGWLLYQSPLLRVSNVSVVGAESVDPMLIAAATGLEGQSLFTADIAGAEEKLSTLTMLKSVSIERQWPTGMRVRIEERRPWGYWQIKEQLYVIDDEGVVLDNGRPEEDAPTVLQADSERRYLPGESVDKDAVALSKQLIESAPRTMGRDVTGLEYSDRQGLTVVLSGGLRVTFGDSRDLDYKLSTLYVLLERTQAQDTPVHSVDLRFGETISFQ
jgi:cell division protein FtsQ